MNIIRLAGEVFLIYLLYRLIFDFIIPVYQTSKRVKKQFGEMESKMQEHMHKYEGGTAQKTQPAPTQPQKKKEEYIDYEEIKD
ncbi:MAG: hypothetical protein ABIO55_04675 [Ginsengibacter sp.]